VISTAASRDISIVARQPPGVDAERQRRRRGPALPT
jgi:hypothetical protein